MKHLIIILFACILALAVACNDKSPEYDERLTEVYNIMATTEKIDSAFGLLKEMNINRFFTEQDRAYYAYLYTVALYLQNAHAENDELIAIAIDYYSKNGDAIMKSKVFMYAAFVYESIKEKDIAVEYYNKALQAIPEDSVSIKATIYMFWADMINRDKPNNESFELLEKTKEYGRKAGNTHLVANANIQQGANHLYNNRIDDAINSYKEAVDLLENYQWGDALNFASLNKLAYCYAHKGENETALQYANEAKKYVRSITNRRYLNGTLCDIYINLKQWEKAEECLALSDDTMAYNGKVYYLEHLIDIERGKGNYRKARDYAERYAVCVDSMYHENIEDNSAMYQKKYDKTKVELEKAELEVDNKQLERSLLIVAIILCLLVVSVVIIAYRRRMAEAARNKAKDDAMSNLTQELQHKIIELQDVRLQLAELESDVNNSQQELEASKLQSQELKEQIFEMNEVVKKIKELKKIKTADLYGKKSVLRADEIAVLMEALNTCYNGVVNRLKEAVVDINKEELSLCCLMLLNVPMTKIALLLGYSEEAVRQKKYRLYRSKMNLPENVTLDEFIENLKGVRG
ncbi:MAG: hypothetical protein E7080_07030 [Bacteroidales bacterium]|nr:hypothetical protein [Bacteroidales bacterium]